MTPNLHSSFVRVRATKGMIPIVTYIMLALPIILILLIIGIVRSRRTNGK